MSGELTEDLKTKLNEMSKVCADLAYYVEGNAHFDGYEQRRHEYDELMTILPTLVQDWDRLKDRERTDQLLAEQAGTIHRNLGNPGSN